MSFQRIFQAKPDPAKPLQTKSLFAPRPAPFQESAQKEAAFPPIHLGQDHSAIPFKPVRPAPALGPSSISCPFTPERCPFGGACHACPPKMQMQAKLKIGQPGDRYEQEADRVAETVMRMPEPQAQRKAACSSCADKDEDDKLMQTKPLAEQITPLVQRKPGPEAEKKDEDDDELLQAKSASGIGNAQEVHHPLIQSVLASPGQPLDAATRRFMEPRFGQDFSGVRVHVGGQAAESARAVNARAYTVGRDVVFGEGQYAPGNDEGRRLVAHELAHVGQQSRQNTLGFTVRRETAPTIRSERLQRFAQKVVSMMLIAGRGLIIAKLEDGTKESVKLSYDGKPQPGDYLFDAVSRELEPDAHGTPNVNGDVFVFWTPLDTKFDVSGKIPFKVVNWSSSIGHRIQAQPELAEAMPGTKVRYYFATDPELGGKYEYKWWCENDPAEAKQRGEPLVVQGPIEAYWDATWAFPGRHTVVCEVTDKNTNTKERLEFYQKVRTESDIAEEAFAKSKPPDYSRFRAGLELQNLNLMQGGLQDQSDDGKPPFISCAGQNPAVPGIAPSLAYNTYTITPSSGAKKFRWYARPQVWDHLPTQQYYGYNKVSIKGVDVYNLASDGLSAKFIIADSKQVWTIICEEFDGSDQPLGTNATYRQVIQSQAQAEQLAKWQAYMKRSDAAIGKIADKKEVGLRASYVNSETGQTMPLQLYVGPSTADPKKVVLVDLLPGIDKIEYSGDSIDAVLADFDTNNSYPKGTIKLEVPSNSSGIPGRAKTLDTKGESDWALWSSRVGWASLGFAVAGVVAAAIPGGQPVAAALFIAAGATGATAGSLSLYDRLQKAEKSPAGIVLDIASIAASIIGGAGAIRALRAGSFALAATGKVGQFILYSGFATNAVSGLIISVEGIDQIIKILDSPMSRGEKISALVRTLGMLILQGALFALSVREIKQMRGRISGLLGEELTNKLPTDVLHSLNLLDDKALKALAGMTAEQLTQVAKIARVDPKLANRLASIRGLALGEHEVGVAGGILSLDGQIKLNPGKLAAMSDEEVKKLMQATKALKAAGGDLSQLSVADRKLVEDLWKSTGQRLRFEAHLKQTEQFVAAVGATADARGQKLFANMSDNERRRLYDLANAKRPGTGNLDKQASDFALGRARSVAEYVELFESYAAKYNEVLKQQIQSHKATVRAEFERRLAANPSMTQAEQAKLPKTVEKELSNKAFGKEIEGLGPIFQKAMAAKVENDLGAPGNPAKAGSGGAQTQATLEANKQALTGHIGSERIASGMSDTDVISKIKVLPEVKFASETAASYHVEKHIGELPPSEITGNKVSDFLTSAKTTIQNGTPTVKVNQDGSRNVIFTREVTEGSYKRTLTAMVNVTEEGKVSLATYMGVEGK